MGREKGGAELSRIIKQVVAELLREGFVFQTPWLDCSQAAQYLKISASYLNQLRSQGGSPPCHKIGSRVLYHAKEVDEWVRSR